MLSHRLFIEIGHVRYSRTFAHRWHLAAAGRNANGDQNRETDHVRAARLGFNEQLVGKATTPRQKGQLMA